MEWSGCPRPRGRVPGLRHIDTAQAKLRVNGVEGRQPPSFGLIFKRFSASSSGGTYEEQPSRRAYHLQPGPQAACRELGGQVCRHGREWQVQGSPHRPARRTLEGRRVFRDRVRSGIRLYSKLCRMAIPQSPGKLYSKLSRMGRASLAGRAPAGWVLTARPLESLLCPLCGVGGRCC